MTSPTPAQSPAVTLTLSGLPRDCPRCGGGVLNGEWKLGVHAGLLQIVCLCCFTAVAPVHAVAAPQAAGDQSSDEEEVPMVCTVCRQPVEAGSQTGMWFHSDSGNPANCSRTVPVKAMVAAGNEKVT